MRFKYVLLDLDGTLTDSAPGILNCFRYALRELGRSDIENDDLRWTLGPPMQKSFEKILDTTDEAAIQVAVNYYRERFSTLGWLENSVYDGVENALVQLKETEVKLFVATSKPRVFAQQILSHFELESYFEGIYGSELDGTRGAKGSLIAYLLAQEGLNPREGLMIGDREHDVLGALANEMPCLGVTYGYGSREELGEAGAVALVDHPREWLPFVTGRTGTL